MGAVALTLLSLALHASALRGWWLSDDPQVLVQAVRQSPSEYFFVPRAWQYLSASNFTPLVTLSFEIDLALAGLRPWFFYLHQIVVLTMAGVLLFFYLQPFTRTLPALLGSAVFLVSPQAVLAARTLMIRHYLEGLALSLIALLLWRRGRSRSPLVWSLLAAVAYLLALLAKEVYALIPLLMLLDSALAREPWKKTLQRFIPTGIAGLAYIAWRVHMLGSAGGYGGQVRFVDLEYLGPGVMASGPPAAIWAVAAGLALLFLVALVRRPRQTLLVTLTAAIVVMVPLVPVLWQWEARYGFVLFAMIGAFCALGVHAGASPEGSPVRRVLATAGALLVLVASLLAGLSVRRSHSIAARDSVAEGKFVWSGGEGDVILLARSPGWYLSGLAELRGRETAAPSRYILSSEGLWVEPLELSRVVQASEGRVSGLPAVLTDAVRRARGGFDPAAPIRVELTRQDHEIRWDLGPESTDSWVFLSYPGYDEYVIPARGSRIIPEPQGRQHFRVMRRLPGGRWTVTPPLALPEANQTVRFAR